MAMADGKETMDTRVHRARRMCLDLDRRQRLNQRHLLLRSNRRRCPVDLGRTRPVHQRQVVLLHSRRHHRTQRELHRIQIHKLVDKAKALETHGWDFNHNKAITTGWVPENPLGT